MRKQLAIAALAAVAFAVPVGAAAQDELEAEERNCEGASAMDPACAGMKGEEAAIDEEGYEEGTEQRTASPYPAEETDATVARTPREKESDRGLQVQAQGGVLTFPGEAAADVTAGGMYGVSVGIEPFPVAELELSYQGAAYMTAENLGEQRTIVENGGQAILKASPLIGITEPYVFGGVGVSSLQVNEDAAGPDVVQDDTLWKVPVGVGVDFHVPTPGEGSFLVGARGTYDLVFDNEAFVGTPGAGDNGNRSSDQLGISLNLGAQF